MLCSKATDTLFNYGCVTNKHIVIVCVRVYVCVRVWHQRGDQFGGLCIECVYTNSENVCTHILYIDITHILSMECLYIQSIPNPPNWSPLRWGTNSRFELGILRFPVAQSMLNPLNWTLQNIHSIECVFPPKNHIPYIEHLRGDQFGGWGQHWVDRVPSIECVL
jgi:hypothetical protein